MNKIRKVDAIIDEERGQMIAHEIMIATGAVYLGGETVSVSTGLATSIAGNND